MLAPAHALLAWFAHFCQFSASLGGEEKKKKKIPKAIKLLTRINSGKKFLPMKNSPPLSDIPS